MFLRKLLNRCSRILNLMYHVGMSNCKTMSMTIGPIRILYCLTTNLTILLLKSSPAIASICPNCQQTHLLLMYMFEHCGFQFFDTLYLLPVAPPTDCLLRSPLPANTKIILKYVTKHLEYQTLMQVIILKKKKF